MLPPPVTPSFDLWLIGPAEMAPKYTLDVIAAAAAGAATATAAYMAEHGGDFKERKNL